MSLLKESMQLSVCAILSCVAVGIFLLRYVLSWWRAFIHLRHIPSIKMNVLSSYYLGLSYVYKSKHVPFTTYVLEIICGNCVAFEKQRISKMWIMFRPLVLFYKPETVEAILTSNVTIEKANEYCFLHPWLGTGLLTSSGNKWRSHRKLLTPAFHFRILEDFQPIFNEQSMILVNRLKEVSHEKCVNIIPLVTKCTLDIICESTMGVRINAQSDHESEYIRAISEIGDQFVYRVTRPWLWITAVYYIFPSGRRFKQNLNLVHGFTRKVIREKKEELLKRMKNNSADHIPGDDSEQIIKRKRKAFLELLLEHHINDASLTDEEIREEVDTFMFEGHDTTAMAMCWTLYNIGLRPDIQEKVLKEIDEIFADDKERPITTEDLKAMKYLDCVIKESLRLYPSVPIFGREAKEDINIKGYTITPGCFCMVVPFILHRDPETYPNPEVFDPDRFLPENSAGRHPFAYVPFSAGARNCIGQRFAIMEEKTVLANIFRNFKIKSLDPRDRIMLLPDLVLRSNGPIRIELTSR